MSTATQIDTTSCERILRYLDRDPRIAGIVEVIDPGTSLARVGDMFLDEDEHNLTRIKELSRGGKILVYSNARHCRIPPGNAVHCLRLEPYYLIKNLHTPYA